MVRFIIILIAISNFSLILSHPEPSFNNHVSKSYKADDSFNELTNDTDSKVTVNGVLSGVKKLFTQEKPEDIVDTIAGKILEYAKTKSRRSSDRDLVQPAVVHFESKRPSVMLKMDTKSLVDVLTDALNSKTVKSFVKSYARRAAEVYYAVKQKLEEVNSNNNKQ